MFARLIMVSQPSKYPKCGLFYNLLLALFSIYSWLGRCTDDIDNDKKSGGLSVLPYQ